MGGGNIGKERKIETCLQMPEMLGTRDRKENCQNSELVILKLQGNYSIM